MLLDFEMWSITKKSDRHQKNEDSSLNINNMNIFNTSLFIVCDGVGGYAGADIASKMIVTKFEERFNTLRENSKSIEETIRQTIHDVNKEILKYAQEHPVFPRLSSTLVGVLIINNTYHAFSVGDSRIYLRDKIGFRQINEDDSRVWNRFKAGLIKKSEIIKQNDKNKITAAIGFRENIEPHYYCGELKDYSQILLCSDGLTDFVTEGDIENHLSHDIAVREKCLELINNALKNGSNDDITVTIIETDIEKTINN